MVKQENLRFNHFQPAGNRIRLRTTGTQALGSILSAEENIQAPIRPAASKRPQATLLEKLTRPWTLRIMWVIAKQGPARFGVLRRAVSGISARILTERLRFLEDNGFFYRSSKPTIPPEVTYGPTMKMRELEKVLDEFCRVTEKWKAKARTGIQRKTRFRT